MSDTFGVQLPLVGDIGGKVSPNVFLGGYFGLAFGGSAGATGLACDRQARGCGAFRLNLGVEVQVHIQPDRAVDPWLGYGIGWELAQLSETRNTGNRTTSVSGIDFAHFQFGVDFRINRTIGVGPLMDMSLGEYLSSSVTTGNTNVSGDIPNKSVHGWFLLGARVVFFP